MWCIISSLALGVVSILLLNQALANRALKRQCADLETEIGTLDQTVQHKTLTLVLQSQMLDEARTELTRAQSQIAELQRELTSAHANLELVLDDLAPVSESFDRVAIEIGRDGLQYVFKNELAMSSSTTS